MMNHTQIHSRTRQMIRRISKNNRLDEIMNHRYPWSFCFDMYQFTTNLANQMWRMNKWHIHTNYTHFLIHMMCESWRIMHHEYVPHNVWTQLYTYFGTLTILFSVLKWRVENYPQPGLTQLINYLTLPLCIFYPADFSACWLTFIVDYASGPNSNWITFYSRYQAVFVISRSRMR